MSNISIEDRVRGCLIGGACGDALGAPVEFSSLMEILAEYGPEGVRDFRLHFIGLLGAISDETQIILFATSALAASREDASLSEVEHLHWSYLSWLGAQGGHNNRIDLAPCNKRLFDVIAVQGDRVPNSNVLIALRGGARLGKTTAMRNKCNGAVVRAAPIGLLYRYDPEKAFNSAVADARLTHSHPRGFLPAGAFAMLTALVASGSTIASAVERTLLFLSNRPDHRATSDALLNGPWRWSEYFRRPSWMGFGWSGDEALAIAVSAVMTTATFEDAVAVAVNHDGDSDTTGSMTGNLAGTLYGATAIPPRWAEQVELRDELERAASSLLRYVPVDRPAGQAAPRRFI